jgi:hypothetical protein
VIRPRPLQMLASPSVRCAGHRRQCLRLMCNQGFTRARRRRHKKFKSIQRPQTSEGRLSDRFDADASAVSIGVGIHNQDTLLACRPGFPAVLRRCDMFRVLPNEQQPFGPLRPVRPTLLQTTGLLLLHSALDSSLWCQIQCLGFCPG